MEIMITAPKDIKCNMRQWKARYAVLGDGVARIVRIESRSAIDVVVAKVEESGILGPQSNYYIASPNFGVAIPGISTLKETFWITEQLIKNNMPAPDAVTIAEVLSAVGDF